MPGPVLPGTLPDTFSAWLQLLQSQGFDIQNISDLGITTIDGLKQWLATQGYQLIPMTQQIEQVVGYTIGKITPADAANTDLQSVEVVYEVAKVAGGQAVAEVISGRNKIIGAVSKFVAVGACLSLLIESIGSFIVPKEVQVDLVTSADPYTMDGENVAVLIDENGKTHFPAGLVEAVRAKAIELGIFDSETGISGYTPTNPDYTLTKTYPYPILVNDGDARTHWSGGYTEATKYDFYVRARMTGSYAYNQTRLFIIKKGSYGQYYTSHNGRYTSITTPYQFNGETYYYTSMAEGDNTNRYNQDCQEMNTNYWFGENLSDAIKLLYFNDSMGTTGGVEGITPAQDLITAGVADVTKSITEVIPELEQGKIQTSMPIENDLENKFDWYPVSINSEDVFTDGVTEEESSTATKGNVKDSLQPAIADAVQSLIEHLYPDGIPGIEVGDTGDTPPENPPLIPPSDVTGSNGLWSIYNPSLQNVNDFGAWLWSDSLADQFKRIFNSPIDGVIGFHMLYCTPSTGTAKPIKCGFLQSPVSAPVVTNPYVEINCGTVSIDEYYRNAMDYDNTRISVYLPFIGIVPLDTNIVMGSDINIMYRVDVLTGTCLAQIKVIKENSDAVMYAFDGNCAVQIPLTATTYTGMIGALLGGISAGASIMTGNMVQAIGSGMRALASGMTGLSGAKQSGTFGANVGALGIRIPYVIITHPVTAMPTDFNKLEGIPSNNAVVLGSLSGYTRVRSVHLENIGKATQEEIQMIQEQLEQGVII